MSKFQSLFAAGKAKGKAGLQGSMQQLMPIAAVTAGVIAGQKFLDFKTMFKDKFAKEPENALFKYEGEIKVAGACFALGFFGAKMHPLLKLAIMGVGVQGGIKMARKYTMDEAGKSFFEQIGQGNFDSDIQAAKDRILKFAANTSNTGVAGNDDDMSGKDNTILQTYSNTGVAGMGADGDYSYSWAN